MRKTINDSMQVKIHGRILHQAPVVWMVTENKLSQADKPNNNQRTEEFYPGILTLLQENKSAWLFKEQTNRTEQNRTGQLVGS
jgi:hypothetical protein